MLDAHFAASVAGFRADDQGAAARPTGTAGSKIHVQPVARPSRADRVGAGYLCPVPYLALAKATPWSVYFTGLSRYGEGFARDLGGLFEQYVGQAAAAARCPGARRGRLRPQNNRRKTVDWIVILPEAVLLVEVKSAIPPSLSGSAP